MTKFIPTFWLLTLSLCLGIAIPGEAQKGKKGPSDSSPATLRMEAEYNFTDGERYFMLEDFTKALFYFQRVAELEPNNAAVHYKIAEVLARSNKDDDLKKAAESIGTALRLEKNNPYYYQLAANIYANLTDFPKAIESMETMMQEVKGTEESLYELAAYYQYDHKPQEAIRTYDKAEKLMGINEISSLQKQRLYIEMGKTDEALAEGQKLMDAFPDEERFVMGFAETLSQFKHVPRAIAFLNQYLKDHPESGPAKMLLSGLYRDNGEEERSRQLTLAAMEDPTLEVSSKVLMLGAYAALLGQAEAKKSEDPDLKVFVLSLLEKLKTDYPLDPSVHLAGGDLNLTLRRNEEAQREYLAAIQCGSTNYEAWERLLYLESQGNAYDSIIRHSESAIEIFPNQPLLFYFNGYAQMRLKHFREAATSLEQAKKLSSTNPNFRSEINSMLGDVYNATKEYKKSDQSFDAALAINPNYDIVLNNYSFYLALRKESLEKAEKMSSLLIKRNPTNSSFLDTHAWVLFMRGRYKEAKKVMERALVGGTASATLYEHYGDILFQLDEVDDAVKQWQLAKSLDSGNLEIDRKIANRKLY